MRPGEVVVYIDATASFGTELRSEKVGGNREWVCYQLLLIPECWWEREGEVEWRVDGVLQLENLIEATYGPEFYMKSWSGPGHCLWLLPLEPEYGEVMDLFSGVSEALLLDVFFNNSEFLTRYVMCSCDANRRVMSWREYWNTVCIEDMRKR